jgi:SAM-dependent methyltransferase
MIWRMRLFDVAAEQYDAARPSYPAGVYDLLDGASGGLAGKSVADGGAGTGIVSRQLIGRGARVVAFDPGSGMLRRAIAHSPQLPVVVADGAQVPFRSSSLEVICFGQSWHWLNQELGAQEAARVLRPGGWWAAWWNHPWADSESWFDDYYVLLETRCEGFSRHQRNVDWCSEAIANLGLFQGLQRHIVAWERRVSVEHWLTDLVSHSYVIDLAEPDRTRLLIDVNSILRKRFLDGAMIVPYQTRLWMAERA